MASSKTAYGPPKYAALNLLLARWARAAAVPGDHMYVTLGGTELRDVAVLKFIDSQVVGGAISFELDSKRVAMAKKTASKFKEDYDLEVQIVPGEFFDYERTSDTPHLFFLDLEGIFAWGDRARLLGRCLANSTIVEGDTFVVTSYLGRHKGWEKVFSTFEAEFSMLRASSVKDRRHLYRWAHPCFTVFQALESQGLSGELNVACIGCVRYFWTSPMGVWGFRFAEGRTRFTDLIRSGYSNRFDIKKGLAPTEYVL